MSVRPAKTRISLGIRPVWSESSLCAQWVAKDPSFLHTDSEEYDQTGRTVTLLVLSCRGSFICIPNLLNQDLTETRIVFKIFVYNQGASSLSECSHWSFWLDTICMGENKFGRNPFPKKYSKSYSILVRIKQMDRCFNSEGYKII